MSQSSEVSRKLIIDEYNRMLLDATRGQTENLNLAEKWGKAHIIIGLSAALFSSLSAAFTFLNNQFIVVISALTSTVLATCITFLNPSSREVKRRKITSLFSILCNRIQQAIVIDCHPSKSEAEMLQKLGELSSQFEASVREIMELL